MRYDFLIDTYATERTGGRKGPLSGVGLRPLPVTNLPILENG
jgi:hypothetical protein